MPHAPRTRQPLWPPRPHPPRRGISPSSRCTPRSRQGCVRARTRARGAGPTRPGRPRRPRLRPAREGVLAVPHHLTQRLGVGLPVLEVGHPGLALGAAYAVLGPGHVGGEPRHQGHRLVHLDVVEAEPLDRGQLPLVAVWRRSGPARGAPRPPQQPRVLTAVGELDLGDQRQTLHAPGPASAGAPGDRAPGRPSARPGRCGWRRRCRASSHPPPRGSPGSACSTPRDRRCRRSRRPGRRSRRRDALSGAALGRLFVCGHHVPPQQSEDGVRIAGTSRS